MNLVSHYVKLMLAATTLFCVLLLQGVNLSQETSVQTASSEPVAENIEQIWVGWLESPQSHLRWILKVKKQSGKWSGVIVLPDLSSLPPIPVTKLSVTDTSLSFTWLPTAADGEASFIGNVEQSHLIKGLVLQGESSVFSQLKRVDKVSEESPDTLGADSVWTDQIPVRAKILPYDIRLRIYSSGPFYDGVDRILLDSRSSNITGAPVKLNQANTAKWSFQIPSLKVEYEAEINAAGDTLSGFLSGNANSKALVLYNWMAFSNKAKQSPSDRKSIEKPNSKKATSDAAIMESKPPSEIVEESNPSSVKIKLNESKEAEQVVRDGEEEFLLTVASPNVRSKSDPSVHQLGCTLKMPPQQKSGKVPLAIIVSTFDAQERDGIVGEFRIYKELANSLAENGVATIRYDDRGTGRSSPVSPEYGLQEAISDLKAILDFAKEMPEVDKAKIGFVGHGFGATLSTKLASLDSSVAFLVCLAPPGIDGSRLLLEESKRSSELEQLEDEEIQLLIELQKDLHTLAKKPLSNETQMALEFDDLFRRYWPRLEISIPKSTSNDADAEQIPSNQIKLALEEKLRNDLAGLRTRFNRDFLAYDPSSSWMILQTPTLAIWGDRDVQVDASTNQETLKQAVRRNSKNRVNWVVLPHLNHLFQESKTGLISEYQELGVGVSAVAIDSIVQWLDDQRIVTRK